MRYVCVKDCGSVKEGDIVKVLPDDGTFWVAPTRYCLFTKDGKYLGNVSYDTLSEHFEFQPKKLDMDRIKEIKDECTVTKEESKSCNNTYRGWEILKLIEEGKVKNGTRFETSGKDENWYFECFEGNIICENNEMCAIDLINSEFKMVKPKRFVSFAEALQQGLNIKRKDWDTEHTTPQNVLNHYTKLGNGDILNDLFSNEKVWEVQNDKMSCK